MSKSPTSRRKAKGKEQRRQKPLAVSGYVKAQGKNSKAMTAYMCEGLMREAPTLQIP